jgi:hypothetical protein
MAMKPMRDGQAKIFSLHSALCRQLNLHCQSGKGKKEKKKETKSAKQMIGRQCFDTSCRCDSKAK